MRSKDEIKAEMLRILPKKRITKNTKVHMLDYFMGYKQALRWVLKNG